MERTNLFIDKAIENAISILSYPTYPSLFWLYLAGVATKMTFYPLIF
jgi:hypothetical protein